MKRLLPAALIGAAAALGGCAGTTARRLASPDEGARNAAYRRYDAYTYRDQLRVIGALTDQLSSPDLETRLRTSWALGSLSPLPAGAVGPLIKALTRETERSVREELRACLVAVEPDVLARVGRTLLRMGPMGWREFTALAGALGTTAAGPLRELLRSEDPVLRLGTLRALVALDAGPLFIDEQVGLLADSDAAVRRQATENVRRLCGAPETVTALYQAPPGAWPEALKLLRESRAFSPEPLVRAMRCRTGPSGRERDEAYARVVALGREAVPALLDAVRADEKCATRVCALDALCDIPAGAEETAAALSRLLTKTDECGARSKAVVLVRRFPDRAPLFLPALLEILRSPLDDYELSLSAIGTLKAYGRSARKAVPTLQRILAEPSLAGPAADALGLLGADPRATFETLRAAQKALFIDYSVFIPVGDAAVDWLEAEYRTLDPASQWFQREQIESALQAIASPASLEAWARLERADKKAEPATVLVRCPVGDVFRVPVPRMEWIACPRHPNVRVEWRKALVVP